LDAAHAELERRRSCDAIARVEDPFVEDFEEAIENGRASLEDFVREK